MRTQLYRQNALATPNSKANSTFEHQKIHTIDTYDEHPSLKTKTYSFQDLPQSLNQFCNQIHEVHALLNIGKRITDPNVLMLNSTQKEMVEMIIDNNKHSQDQKAKFLTQRARKYIKLLWKTEKFNDSLFQNTVKLQKNEPRYASPIHNFKKAKISPNHSLNPFTHRTNKSIDGKNQLKNIHRIHKNSQASEQSRARRLHSEDQTFSNVRLGKLDRKKGEKQKSIQVDLTKNIAWRTINTTKNFENMLKILKKQS